MRSLLLIVLLATTQVFSASTSATSDSEALWRSAVLPGWGQFYKERNLWGYTYSISFGAGLLMTTTSIIIWQNFKSQYRNYQPSYVTSSTGEVSLTNAAASQAEFSRLENASNDWTKVALISGISTLLIYTINLFDAYLGESRVAKKLVGTKEGQQRIQISVQQTSALGLGLFLQYTF
ncbi:MAG: hypothetical protein JNJ69_12735 [Leptospiraceae bacterium]|nr:hypothetical protein [Leptospiraceae bacterium]